MKILLYLIWEGLRPIHHYIKAGAFGLALAPWIKSLAATLLGDLQFTISMSIVVAANALLSFAVDVRYGRVTYWTLLKALGLACAYLIALVIFHQAAKSSLLMSWLDAAIYGAIMCIEVLRCIESLAHLGIVIPSFIRSRLKTFADDGTPIAPVDRQKVV